MPARRVTTVQGRFRSDRGCVGLSPWMAQSPARGSAAMTARAGGFKTIDFFPVLESGRCNMPRSKSTSVHRRLRISRSLHPVNRRSRIAPAAKGAARRAGGGARLGRARPGRICAAARAGGIAQPPARGALGVGARERPRPAAGARVRGSALGRSDLARRAAGAGRARRAGAAADLSDHAARIPPALEVALAPRRDLAGAARRRRGRAHGRRDREPALRAALDRLADAELLFVEGVAPHANYRFKHALIQDAAYDSLLKSRRQTLHRRAAEVLLALPAPEAEALAHHFTQAGQTELAIEWWGKAGDQALRRSAFAEAISHLGKAIEMADKGEGAASNAPAPTDQRLKLQTSYGQAMGYLKGFAAEETKTVLAQTLGLAAQSGNVAERLKAHYARWIALYTGGELESAHEAAEGFLREAKLAGDAPAVAYAGRVLGQTCLFQGRFAEAREHLCEALRVYSPGWDASVRRQLGSDAGIGAKAFLAMVAWHVGDATGAAAQFEAALTEALASEHVPTIANNFLFKVLHEMLRGDAEATLRAANVVLEIAEKSGLRLYESAAHVFLSWAQARLGAADGLARFRGHGETAVNRDAPLFAPLFHGRLAELEAEQTSVEVALISIDRAIELAGAGDIRHLDAWLRRIRGDILAKADPANVGPAEEAYLAAISVARAGRAQLRPASGVGAGEALPIDRARGRSP
jgi:tetratricopeptide (TPR) repeat protein